MTRSSPVPQQVQPARKAVWVPRTRPTNAGTRNPRGLTHPVQDSNRFPTTGLKQER